jgi:hypothetical protein
MNPSPESGTDRMVEEIEKEDNCPTCGEPWEDHEPQISEKGAGCLCPRDMRPK